MKRTLLAVLAHPDDESYGLGGTLARYAREGVDVHVAIATDGAAGSIDERWQGDHNRLVEARAEEVKAAAQILGVTLHNLGYRDSGYIGDPANQHPAAFINADQCEAAGRVVRLIRELRPQVVITHDETGGYFHPDHIQCYKITTAAFQAAGSPEQYPDIGPAPYQPERLYYTVFPNRWVKFFIFLMRLRRLDPTKAGRNKDVDFTRLGVPWEKISTAINYRKYWDIKRQASAQHGSQGGGAGFSRLFPTGLQKLIFANEYMMRAHPPAAPGNRERDLFDGL
ncbi:MAG: PIG-L family deacetylase [Chloroflexi bacterium]|nr:PIG-L family deacetylase [Chloroflexota bacterium]